jgi:CheY-like chemotaxis protein
MRYSEDMRRMPSPLLLVVDDDARAAGDLETWLRAQGWNAVAATSCFEAEAVIAAAPIDGLIGHLALPDGSLFTIAQSLRARRTPVAVVGYADVDVRPPPELDLCFVRPLDLSVLRSFLMMFFRSGRSGEHPKISVDRRHSVPPMIRRRR